MDKVTVTYIKHSGFLVETKESYLLFDYWEGKLPELQYDKELYVFFQSCSIMIIIRKIFLN